MFRIVCDPSSGGMELYFTKNIRSGSLMFVVYLIEHTTNTSQPLRISVKYSSILPDDGSHTIRNMLERFLILCLLKFLYTVDFKF